MEQTVHTNTDLNGKLTATQHRQVFHWILYRSEWFWAMMSSLSSEQVMSALWMVCVLCVCVRVCVWSGAGCPRVVAHSVPHPRLWMYSSETRRVQTMQDVFWAADVFHICTGVTWSRDITRTHQEGFNHTTTKQTTTNCIDLDLACSTLSLFFILFFPLGFLLSVWSGHQSIRQEGKSCFSFKEAASSPQSQTGFSDSTAALSLTVTGSRPRALETGCVMFESCSVTSDASQGSTVRGGTDAEGTDGVQNTVFFFSFLYCNHESALAKSTGFFFDVFLSFICFFFLKDKDSRCILIFWFSDKRQNSGELVVNVKKNN